MKSERRILGVDVGCTNIKSGWVHEGEIDDFKNVPVDPEGVIAEVIEIIRSYEEDDGSVIGVGFPGFINEGRVHSPPNLPSVREVDLQKKLRDETHHHVYVFNDADAYILGEALFGAGRGSRIVLGLTLGTGVGGGFVVDGEVYTGSRGFATEFGHMTIDPNGPLCHCGKRGCLEAFIGSYGLKGRYKVDSGEKLTVKEIFVKAEEGEKIALKVVNEFGLYLSIGIKNLVEAFDPDIVVLGGGITKSGNFILELIEANQPVSSRPFEDVRIVIGELPDKAGAIGAAFWANKMHKQ